MQIKRTRYVIMADNRTEIWCGLAKNFHFENMEVLKDVAIKTYATKERAIAACSSWKDFEVVKCVETIDIED